MPLPHEPIPSEAFLSAVLSALERGIAEKDWGGVETAAAMARTEIESTESARARAHYMANPEAGRLAVENGPSLYARRAAFFRAEQEKEAARKAMEPTKHNRPTQTIPRRPSSN